MPWVRQSPWCSLAGGRMEGPEVSPHMAHHEQEAPMSSSQDAKLDKILEAIAATRQDLRNRVDALVVEVGLLQEDPPE
ncbi:hypothetical protein NDU88_003724 [Pleurodeles waltl]|uniref:Uncharacterized protein n=1 Tax=Pleurodeles waltl TaxID=8319 RepID=A0AAV7NHG0_PLEWA|nr:hypothetical protein NDU88_003724 [Pleurodeles waltl]